MEVVCEYNPEGLSHAYRAKNPSRVYQILDSSAQCKTLSYCVQANSKHSRTKLLRALARPVSDTKQVKRQTQACE